MTIHISGRSGPRVPRGGLLLAFIMGWAPVLITATSSRAQAPQACDTLPSTPDTVDAVIFGNLFVLPGQAVPPAPYRARVLEGLRRALVLPTRIGALVFQVVRVDPAEMKTLGPMAARGIVLAGIGGAIEFTLDSAGHASDVQLTTTSMTPDIDRAFVDAAQRADSLHAFPVAAGTASAQPTRFRFVIGTAMRGGSGGPPGTYLGFFETRLPTWRESRRMAAVKPVPRMPRPPHLPETPGGVNRIGVDFVVDQTGRVVPETVAMSYSMYASLLPWFRDHLRGWRFEPSMIGACPISEPTVQEFDFGPD